MKLKFLVLMIFIVASDVRVKAQFNCIDCNEDSLQVLWKQVKTSPDSVYMLATAIDNGDSGGSLYNYTEKEIEQIDLLLKINSRLKLIKDQPYVHLRAGILLWKENKKLEAIDEFKKSIELFDEQNKILGDLSVLNKLRSYYSNSGLSEERFKYYTVKLKQYKENGPIENTAVCYHALAGYYLNHRNDYNLAINNYLKSAEAFKSFSLSGYTNEITIIGFSYFMWGNIEKAKFYLDQAKPIIEKTKRWNLSIISLQTLAKIDAINGDYHEALSKIDQSILICDTISAKGFFAISLAEKGNILLNLNRFDEALNVLNESIRIKDSLSIKPNSADGFFEGEYYLYKYFLIKKQFENAETELLNVLDNALVNNANVLIQKYRKELVEFYADQKNYEKAAIYSRQFISLQDSLIKSQNKLNIASYENEKLERDTDIELKQIALQKSKQKFYFQIGFALLLLIALFIFSRLQYTRKIKKQLEGKNKIIAAEKQRAEQSEKFKQQFLANMSHEIRTPMNAVMGMTNLLMEKNPRSDQFHYLDGIKKSSDNLLHIINDILDLSKIEVGKMELEQIDFSLRDMVEQVKQTINHKADEKGLELIIDFDPNIPAVLIGDPTRLNQVLINLGGNAIKFTEKGSVIIVLRKSEIENNIRFSIIDTGIGIPKEKLQAVFESFSQANTSDTRKFGGTGLGLSISKQLVELMGGTISIESEEGAGTAFSFEINLPGGSYERMQEQNSSEQIDGSVLKGLKILVVDDNEYNRIVVHDTLKLMADVEIVQATNGQEAIDAVSQYSFDIILMDVQMPLMNGYEATRYIREKMHAPKNAIPVIALTASVIRSDLDKCRAAGMNDYVPKPFKKAQLISAIAKVTGREMKFTAKRTAAVNLEKENHSSVTNLSYLEKFCEGDKILMQKYINMFTASAPVLIEKLNTALLNNDLEEIATQVHGFKTKWIMMGMNESKALALIIEQQCRGQEQDISVKENVLKLIEQIQAAKMELTLSEN